LTADLAAWRLIKGSADPVDFESYLAAFPKSPLAPLARGRLRTLAPARAN
jgi:hypothetical protein